MSTLGALLLLFAACVALDGYRRIGPASSPRVIGVLVVGAVLIALWLILVVLGIGGAVRY